MRPMLSVLVLLTVILVTVPALALAKTRLIELGPDTSDEAIMIGERIEAVRTGGTVHIAYMHGMRAESAGHSAELRKGIQQRFGKAGVRLYRRRIDLGPRPATARFVGAEVWNVADNATSDQRWLASRPFVDRYRFEIGSGEVILDELNWWPLLLPLKCRFMVIPEHDLSGADKKHLRICSQGSSVGRSPGKTDGFEDDAYYPWLSPAEAARLIATRPRSGGGAMANRWLKQQILNWGVADAPIVLGTMSLFIRKGIDAAFGVIQAGESESRVERIAVTESLGSFVLLDAMKLPRSRAAQFVRRGADLFFIANQFALLELARIELDEMAPGQSRDSIGTGNSSVLNILARRDEENGFREIPGPRQVVAISDPSDILTYRVPPIDGVAVVNVAASVSGRWKLFTRPDVAHRGALKDQAVLGMLLRKRKPTPHR